MDNKFFCSLKKNECLKHFDVFFKEQSLKDESLLNSLFECLPNLQSLKLTISPSTDPPSPSFFKCLQECISRSSLEKLHLKVSTGKVFLFRLCLLTPNLQCVHNYTHLHLFLSHCPENVKITLKVSFLFPKMSQDLIRFVKLFNSLLSDSSLKELFVNMPANLTHFCVYLNVDSLLAREDLTKSIVNNETLLECKVYGKNFCWKFEEITDRNKRWQNEGRFKVMKVAAPQDFEAAEEPSILGKRGGFVCDVSDEDNPNKKSKH